MKTKSLVLGLMFCFALLSVSCETNSSDENLYENVDKNGFKVPTYGVDKNGFKVPTYGVADSEVTPEAGE